MQKVKNNWKQILILAVIIIVCAICVREKYFYKSLFSKEFCESIVEIQYISYENEIYTIADEEMIDEFRKGLYETRYRRLSSANGFDGGYSFKLFAETAIPFCENVNAKTNVKRKIIFFIVKILS